MSSLRNRGLSVAVLGPDGSGKSTILSGLVESLPPHFTAARIIHFRPNLGRGNGEVVIVTNPHGEEPRGAITSSAKLLYYLADYLAGFMLVIRPAIRRGELVLFDRYYVDLLV